MKLSTIFVTAFFSLSAFAAPLAVNNPQDVITRDEIDAAALDLVEREPQSYDLVERESQSHDVDLVARGPGSIPSLSEIKRHLHVSPGKSLFYAGPGGYINIARSISHAKGRRILEDSWTDPRYPQPFLDNNPANKARNSQFWDTASLALAEMSSGTVYVLLPEGTQAPNFYPSAIWARVEWPALTKNRAVTKIIMIHPSGGGETVIWPASSSGKSGKSGKSSSSRSSSSSSRKH